MSEATTTGLVEMVWLLGVVKSSGVVLLAQSPARRSKGKSSLVMPISTFEASPVNISMDAFWAFQPNRVTV